MKHQTNTPQSMQEDKNEIPRLVKWMAAGFPPIAYHTELKDTIEVINAYNTIKADNDDLHGYIVYVEDTIGRGAIPRLTFNEWKESGKPLTK